MSATKKDLEELAKAWDERMTPIEEKIGKILSDEQPQKTSSERKVGESEMPNYKCRDGNCGYSSDDIGSLLLHEREHVLKSIDARLAKLTTPKETKEETWEEKAEPKRHKTFKEYLECPQCSPVIEKELVARGWKKPEEKKPKKGLEI